MVADSSGNTTVEIGEAELSDLRGQLAALHRSMGVIEFTLDGIILTANENFLSAMGYSLGEIQGRHHSMFVEPGQRQAASYAQFWADLQAGEFLAGQFRRVAKGGREVWLQASHNPVFGPDGRPVKVVKFATDLTATRTAAAAETAAKFHATSQHLNVASASLSNMAADIASGASETAAQAARVSAAAQQMKSGVASVASASEEMSSTVVEIARNASDSARTARQAKGMATSANTTVQALSASAAAIGKVTKVISSIAQQTNLLALNATIEAARAGHAGKGFAVVANEVKELAKETARATEEISQQIEAIRVDTGNSVVAIGDVVRVIEQIDGFATAIAAAVEEQSATVRGIARNANDVAASVTDVVDNIAGVADAARYAEKNAALAQTAAHDVMQVASGLNAMVSR